jgi:hypothetical protein
VKLVAAPRDVLGSWTLCSGMSMHRDRHMGTYNEEVAPASE